MYKNCEGCYFLSSEQCNILKIPIKANDPACPIYLKEPYTCTLCNQQFIHTPVILQEQDNNYEICSKCFSVINTCQTCSNIQICELQSDNSMPTMIRQRIQQNGMIIEKDTVNPAKIDKCCRGHCKCFSEEFNCLKQNGTCSNYSMRELG